MNIKDCILNYSSTSTTEVKNARSLITKSTLQDQFWNVIHRNAIRNKINIIADHRNSITK